MERVEVNDRCLKRSAWRRDGQRCGGGVSYLISAGVIVAYQTEIIGGVGSRYIADDQSSVGGTGHRSGRHRRPIVIGGVPLIAKISPYCNCGKNRCEARKKLH